MSSFFTPCLKVYLYLKNRKKHDFSYTVPSFPLLGLISMIRYGCMKPAEKRITMSQLIRKPHYRGKHIILIAGNVFIAKTGDEAAEIVEKESKKHPRAIPQIAFFPKGHLTV